MRLHVRQWMGKSIRISLGLFVLWSIVFIAAAAAAVDNGIRYYWLVTQPNPRIVARSAPILNGNVNADGITIQAWVKSGRDKADWIAVPKNVFKRGEMFWVRWDNCFYDKVDGVIYRPFLGPDKAASWELPASAPPKRTPTGECDVTNIGHVIPDWAPLGTWAYAPYVAFWKNPQERVNVWFDEVPAMTIEPADAK